MKSNIYKICHIRANVGGYNDIQQKRNNTEIRTVSLNKMGNFYNQAQVHEFGNIPVLDPVESENKIAKGWCTNNSTHQILSFQSKCKKQEKSCRPYYVQSTL